MIVNNGRAWVRGLERVKTHFSTALIARRTVELYDRLLERGVNRTAELESETQTSN